MEKHIALVNKINKRVVNVLIVDNLDTDYIAQFATNECDVVAVTNSIPFMNGLYDGEVFTQPTNDYLIEIGLVTPIDETEQQLA